MRDGGAGTPRSRTTSRKSRPTRIWYVSSNLSKEWVRVYRTHHGAGAPGGGVRNIRPSPRRRRTKRWRKRRRTKNGGLKIGGCTWKAVILTSWELEIVTNLTTRNEDENGSALPQSFSVA